MADCSRILWLRILLVSLCSVSQSFNDQSDTYSNILLSYVNSLYSESDNLTYNILKIQSIFCPNETLCQEDKALISEIENEKEAPNTGINTGNLNNSMTFESLSRIMTICCVPCSCSNNCYDDGNCCLSKIIRDDMNTSIQQTTNIKTECVTANIMSYFEHADAFLEGVQYLMVTGCYLDRSNDSVVKQCEEPSRYRAEETLPTTSLYSGRTYWNKFCAICNQDYAALASWNATFWIPRLFTYYDNHKSKRTAFPQTFSDFYRNLVRRGYIYYVPPNEIKSQRCVRTPEVRRCNKATDIVIPELLNLTYIQEACEGVYSPVFIQKRYVFANIFCVLCAGVRLTPLLEDRQEHCSNELEKDSFGTISGLLDYKDVLYEEASAGPDSLTLDDNGCTCYQVFDTYKNECRSLYCAPGDIYRDCKCHPMTVYMSGVPAFLKVKILPETDGAVVSKSAVLRRLRNDVETVLESKHDHISVETISTFIHSQSKDSNRPAIASFYFHFLLLKVHHDYDTKELLKDITNHLDGAPLCEVESSGMKFQLVATNRVKILNNGQSARVIGESQDLQNTYTKLYNWYHGMMEVSKLLYCKQVQLTSEEFEDDGEKITLEVDPSLSVGLNYFYQPPTTEIRICLEDYLPTKPSVEASGCRGILSALTCTIQFTSVTIFVFWVR